MKGRTLQIGLLAAVASLLAVAGCAPQIPDPPTPPPGQPPIADTSWVLEAYGEPGNLTPVLPDTEVTLVFDGHDEVTGLTGCNAYGGTYASELDGTLEFGQLHQTEIYCEPPGVMDQEQSFMEALRLAEEYEFVNEYLHVSGGGALLVLSPA